MNDSVCVRAVVIQQQSILLIKRVKFGELYFTLPGGHVDPGETLEEALVRELIEETSLVVQSSQQVFTEPAMNGFARQHIYVCEVDGSTITMQPDSEEALQNKLGHNTYHPGWYAVSDLPSLPFRTTRLASAIMAAQTEGWPDGVVELTSR